MDSAEQLIMWQFVRGGLLISEFEKWLYQNSHFEDIAGNEFYLEVISTDFNNKSEVYLLKNKLDDFLRERWTLSCECVALSDLAIIGEGSEYWEQVFETIVKVKQYGELRWWLLLCQCNKCNQYWLIGRDSRINDVDILKRLESVMAEEIIKKNDWPDCFMTFEELFILSMNNDWSVRFENPYSPELIATIQDLRKKRPSISIAEIAFLLNIEEAYVQILCKVCGEKGGFVAPN